MGTCSGTLRLARVDRCAGAAGVGGGRRRRRSHRRTGVRRGGAWCAVCGGVWWGVRR